MVIPVIASDAHRGHAPAFETVSGREVPSLETPTRADSILAALRGDPDGAFAIAGPRPFGPSPLAAVHDPGLLRWLETAFAEWRAWGETDDTIVADVFPLATARGPGAPPAPEPANPGARMGWWCFDTATGIQARTWDAARTSADIALTAAEAVFGGEPLAYGLCRPPGHHASRAAFGGYCFLNNAAIATEWLASAGAGRVGILDLDVHHGNGTQAIFWERGDVPYASIHADPARTYPYVSGHADETGGGRGSGATLNQPLSPGTGDAAWLAAVSRALDWLVDRTDDLLVVSLGLDTYERDPIGGWGITTACYREAGRRVAASGRRIVVLQEGGYFVPDLGQNVRAWLLGARGPA